MSRIVMSPTAEKFDKAFTILKPIFGKEELKNDPTIIGMYLLADAICEHGIIVRDGLQELARAQQKKG